MRKVTVLIILAMVFMAQAGCVAPRHYTANTYELPSYLEFTEEQVKQLDYGPYPKNYQAIIKNYLKFILKDPDSAKIEFIGKPVKTIYECEDNKTPCYGYGGMITVNAKNGFGAYTGIQPYPYIIWNGHLIFYNYKVLSGPWYQPLPTMRQTHIRPHGIKFLDNL